MVDPTLVELAMHVARTPASGLDLPALLADVCAELPARLEVAAAVIVVLDPAGGVYGSDERAIGLGETQHRAADGPLPNAVRANRPLLTPDLTRVRPPTLATAAAEAQLVTSAALPLRAASWTLGGVQLLGSREQPVAGHHVDALVPLADVLGVLLANVQATLQLTAALVQANEAASEANARTEQAVRMLAERCRIDVEEARRLLQAQHGRVPLADAAAAGAAGGATPVPQPRPQPLVERAVNRPRGRHRRN